GAARRRPFRHHRCLERRRARGRRRADRPPGLVGPAARPPGRVAGGCAGVAGGEPAGEALSEAADDEHGTITHAPAVNQTPESTPRSDLLRVTPYEVAFGGGPYETDVFPAIAADADYHRSDPLRLDPFTLLPATGEAVRSFVPPEAPPEAIEQYRILLYHGFNFWSLGRTTYLIHPATARFLVEAQPRMEGWELTLP